MKTVILTCLIALSPMLLASEQDNEHSPSKFETQYVGIAAQVFQLETYTSGSAIFGPTMGKYGNLGLFIGTRNYDIEGENGIQGATDVGAYWSKHDTIFNSLSNSLVKNLFVKSEIVIGETQYENIATDEKELSHLFTNIALTIGTIDLAEHYNLKYELGVGTGIRMNFFNKDDTPIVLGRKLEKTIIYPQFYIGARI
ncbi:MAG: hypothetical protein ACOH5I_17420 [Oligoflexus sp.]